jgi:hypothetical protein
VTAPHSPPAFPLSAFAALDTETTDKSPETARLLRYLRREANEVRWRVDTARANGDSEAADIAELEVVELNERIDSLSYDWPSRPFTSGGLR